MGPKLVITSIIITAAVFASQGGRSNRLHALRTPLMTAMALGIFAVQWVGLIHARLFETEHYFDLVGSLTYIPSRFLRFSKRLKSGYANKLSLASS